MSKKTCLILNNTVSIPTGKLAHLSDRVDFLWYQRTSANFSLDEALELFPNAQILVSRNLSLDANQLKKLPTLETIIITSTAYDKLDLDYCRTQQIKVFHTPDYASQAVAEHAIGLMFSIAKYIPMLHSEVQTGKFHVQGYRATELAGKQAGIIGLGRIGSRIAKAAQGLGMQVVFHDCLEKTFTGGQQVDLKTLLSTSDVVFLAVPLTSETYHLIGAPELKLMQPSSFLVSIAANEVIDESAVIEALKADLLAGAAIDLSANHPVLCQVKNLVLTPARGWYTPESIEKRLVIWSQTLADYLDDRPIPYAVL